MNIADIYQYVSVRFGGRRRPLMPVLINPSLKEIKWLLFNFTYRIAPWYRHETVQNLRGMIYKRNLYLWPDIYYKNIATGIPSIWVFHRKPIYFQIDFYPNHPDLRTQILVERNEYTLDQEEINLHKLREHPQIQRIQKELNATVG